MKVFLHKIVQSLRLDRRDLTGLLWSLLLASSIWLLHNLTLKYNDYVTVTVSAKSNIDGRTEKSTNTAEVTARARCTGYNLLRSHVFVNKVREISFKADELHYEGNDIYYVTSKELQDHVKEFYGDGSVVEADGFITDTIKFRFGEVSHKKVPVVLNGSFEPEDGFAFVGDIKLSPDSVTVYGETNRLLSVDAVMTKRFFKSGVDKAHSGAIKLQKVRDARLSTDAVHYSFDMSRYVDIEQTAQLHVVGKPIDKNVIILPSVVNVRFRCKFPYVEDPTATAVLYVDYNDYLASRSGKCPVKVMKAGDDLIECVIEPEYVELIEQ